VKPRIVDLEKKGLEWCCEYDLAKLLRLARAAKGVTDNLEPHSAIFVFHDCAVCDLRQALNAFDWGEK